MLGLVTCVPFRVKGLAHLDTRCHPGSGQAPLPVVSSRGQRRRLLPASSSAPSILFLGSCVHSKPFFHLFLLLQCQLHPQGPVFFPPLTVVSPWESCACLAWALAMPCACRPAPSTSYHMDLPLQRLGATSSGHFLSQNCWHGI